MKKCLLLLPCLLMLIIVSQAQIDPLYAQYLNNPLLINPAYAGMNNNLNGSLTYRKQWAGFDGAPTTVNASIHSSVFDNRMGLGFYILQDKAAINKNTEVQATYAYRIELDNKHLSFGLQAGLINYRNNNDDLNPRDPGAPEFSNNLAYTKPGFGAGLILHSDRYLIGLSIPRMLKAKTNINGFETDLYQQHFYLTAAYVVFLNERVRFKPATLIRAVKGAPVSTDVNLPLNFDEKYTVGLYTRNLETYGFLAQIKFKDNYRFGYAFEVPTNQSVGTQFTSHEFTLGINLSVLSFHTTSISNF